MFASHAFRLAILSLGVLQLSLAGAMAAPITLYDGSATPTAEGWTRESNGGTETVGAGTTEFSTLTAMPERLNGLVNLYSMATGASAYIVSIDLEVLASTFNSFDAAITFSPFGNSAAFPASDRNNSLTIGNGVLLWGDNLGGSVSLDTSVFHEYELRYVGGNLDVFVDATYASIAAGTAVPVLSRTGVVLQAGRSIGTIVFGDATNDLNFNSDFIVDFVNFQDLSPTSAVPEPATLTLLSFGLVSLAGRRRRAWL